METLRLLRKNKIKPEIIHYLESPPTEKELKGLLKKLNLKAEQLVRKKEKLFKEKFEGTKISESQWLKILIEHPILMERPIVVNGNRALIGRPPERILEII